MNYYNRFFACTVLGLLADHSAAQVQVENAWVQLAPPTATVNAAYMQIINSHVQPQTIVGLSADCCTMVMLHQTRQDGDKVSMEHLDRLIIPAQASVHLAPGGMHIMLMGVQQELSLGRKVRMTLRFGDGSTQDIELDVKKDEH